jgi:class 3 adenylate cyclase
MARTLERTVLFADLRGSTALFERLGNASATALVTQSVARVAEQVATKGGTVVKTLGDGLMAVFERPRDALRCAMRMQVALEAQSAAEAQALTPPQAARALRLQVAMACGEVVALDDDFYGDAVNVAARLLDLASDGEVLVTEGIHQRLGIEDQLRFRHIDHIVLRGRVEPVSVHAMGGRRAHDSGATAFADLPSPDEPDGVQLTWRQQDRIFDSANLPVVIGRSSRTSFCVPDDRVSRHHARLDWHGGSFQLTDLSSNGTYVRFADGETVSLRRGGCTLHGRGQIGLGGAPQTEGAAVIRFEVVRFGDTRP